MGGRLARSGGKEEITAVGVAWGEGLCRPPTPRRTCGKARRWDCQSLCAIVVNIEHRSAVEATASQLSVESEDCKERFVDRPQLFLGEVPG
jgi:hypothetical protein